ncbi:DUF4177 domain-containing protein [Sporosarcina aquimarina]|uniref:DUF4177 domain-containing protein n=1 Tax=Sporosarcina aquimarina TaxID=114975 RepID=UPI00203B84CB|nr:DUF4177 domain-containing protein [Sporosarcina aquimarina]MCM3756157.1 DUF4177 domain-containing protein [Sporosarcina aquimarina]
MYTYKVVKIKSSWKGTPKENEEQVMNEYAIQGWQLHSIIPFSSTTGGTTDLKLVFEKEAKSNKFLDIKGLIC